MNAAEIQAEVDDRLEFALVLEVIGPDTTMAKLYDAVVYQSPLEGEDSKKVMLAIENWCRRQQD